MRRAVLLLLMSVVLLCWLVRGQAAWCQKPPDKDKPMPHLPAGALEQVSPAYQKGKAAAMGTVVSTAISGVVTDDSGAAVAGVTVVVTSNATGERRTATTDSAGHYTVPNLPPGDYTVTFSRGGLASVSVSHVTAALGQSVSLPVQMSPAVMAKPPVPVLPQPVPDTAEVITGHPAVKDHEPSGSGAAVPPPSGAVEPEKPAPKEEEASGAVAEENKNFEDWHKHLPYGLSQHHVEPWMRLGQPSTVTFTIHGPNAPAFTPEEGSAPDKLQVSPKMSVFLTQPANPGAFTIVDGDSPQNPKRVAPDGVTTWTWFVTPQRLGTLNLHVEAFVLYGNNSDDRASYSSYNDTIQVKSVTLWGYLGSGITWVLQNPGESLKYVLPGGGGAVILGAVIQWVRKRRKNRRSAHGDLPD